MHHEMKRRTLTWAAITWAAMLFALGCGALFPLVLVAEEETFGDAANSEVVASEEPSGHEEATSLVILPQAVALSSIEARQRLLVEQQRAADDSGETANVADLSAEAVFSTSDEAVAVVEDGILIPRGDGEATITATVGDQQATVHVVVTNQQQPFQWSFRNHVQSVLTKTGCNSGACHGAQAGKNGFKLSLRGYDPFGDYDVVTRQARGRRIVPTDPGRSLVLLKPAGGVPHKGGFRFDVDSREYRVLAEWIAAATPPPTEDDPRIEHIEVLPEQAVLSVNATQQLIVKARFSDGHEEDVTSWAKFEATNSSVAEVDDRGRVQVVGEGEGVVTVWYLSRVTAATITVPLTQNLPEDTFAAAPRRNFIDDLVLEKLESINMPPSPRCSDSEFIRRASLDTIGVLPTATRTRAFLEDTGADKRDRLIEELLERQEFVDYWAYKWSDLLLVNSSMLPAPAMWAYYDWVRNNVAANTPWDEMVREVLTATGSTLENGATNFYVLHQDPADLTETTSQAFLGMSIMCAKCHNHPLEKWTNDQYYAMANLYARVRVKDADGAGHSIVFNSDRGDLVQPLRGVPQPPTPLDGEPLSLDSQADRREHLANWVVSPENPYFARAITNRVWANFFDAGLVESVDDLRLTNPASNGKLLAAVSQHLVENEFDLKSLMRTILQSETYQRDSKPLDGNAGDERFYSRYYPRRLMAEVLLDATSQVTMAPAVFEGYPAGWRAIQLPDSSVDSYFLKTFGRPERVITCECERTEAPSMVQVLHLSNGDTLNQKLAASGNRIEQLLADSATPEQIVEEAYLNALSRYPTPEESEQLLQVFAETPPEERRAATEDLFWSILTSKEFLFNH